MKKTFPSPTNTIWIKLDDENQIMGEPSLWGVNCHYLLLQLHCDDKTRNHRLRNREDKATWTDEMLKSHEEFALWLLNNAETAYNPPMPTIDTTSTPPSEVAEQIKRYVMLKWNERNVTI